MKIKYHSLAALVMTAGFFSQPASAISDAYRAQLERSGCTQVSEANGTCNVSQHHSRYDDDDTSQASQRSTEADPRAAREVAHDLEHHLRGHYQGQAVDYMQANDWQPMNEEQSRWSKAGFIADFAMNNSGQIMKVKVH